MLLGAGGVGLEAVQHTAESYGFTHQEWVNQSRCAALVLPSAVMPALTATTYDLRFESSSFTIFIATD